MSIHLDYIVYMTYDLHGLWDATIPTQGAYLNAHNNMTGKLMENRVHVLGFSK